MDRLHQKVRNELGVIDHSLLVAKAASEIANASKNLDAKKAFKLGILHDVGKLFVSEDELYKHPRIGFEIFKDSQREVAITCLLHPFPVPDDLEFMKCYCKNDNNELQKICDTIKQIGNLNSEYVELIQYCDKISGRDRYVTIEEKFKFYSETYKTDPSIASRNYQRLKILEEKFEHIKWR
jgi:putative nucleotidyltransferase with HDIG domain